MINYSIYQNPDTGFGQGYCCLYCEKPHMCRPQERQIDNLKKIPFSEPATSAKHQVQYHERWHFLLLSNSQPHCFAVIKRLQTISVQQATLKIFTNLKIKFSFSSGPRFCLLLPTPTALTSVNNESKRTCGKPDRSLLCTETRRLKWSPACVSEKTTGRKRLKWWQFFHHRGRYLSKLLLLQKLCLTCCS